ncbi:glycosyltransferase family 2 protein [Pedobacter steynii]
MFIRTDVLLNSGIFDERYFMYLEDYDLGRRIHKFAKTVFYPGVTVIHGHAKESYKNGDLFKIHMQSAIRYFNKWGWFFDSDRNKFNQKVLNKLKENDRG